MLFFFIVFATNCVNTGVSTIVVTTAAAIWEVAAGTSAAIEGSTRAMAAGVATALPAVLEAAAPAIPVPPTARSARILKRKPHK